MAKPRVHGTASGKKRCPVLRVPAVAALVAGLLAVGCSGEGASAPRAAAERHRTILYGVDGLEWRVMAPLLAQGKVLAAAITGNETPGFSASTPAAKLKIAGVDVFLDGAAEHLA